jgi:hypothetical protein
MSKKINSNLAALELIVAPLKNALDRATDLASTLAQKEAAPLAQAGDGAQTVAARRRQADELEALRVDLEQAERRLDQQAKAAITQGKKIMLDAFNGLSAAATKANDETAAAILKLLPGYESTHAPTEVAELVWRYGPGQPLRMQATALQDWPSDMDEPEDTLRKLETALEVLSR